MKSIERRLLGADQWADFWKHRQRLAEAESLHP
jgi:hypothetical protein